MKASTLKLCLPVAIITAQHSAAGITIPPFLDSLHYPVFAIGVMIAIAPMFSFSARLPAGFVYRDDRAKLQMAGALLLIVLCNLSYGFAVSPLLFAIVHALNGFTLGSVTTFYLAYFVNSLPPEENRHHAMGYYAGALAIGHSSGGIVAGMIADRFGYSISFRFAAFVALAALVILPFLKSPTVPKTNDGTRRPETRPTLKQSLRATLNPQVGGIVVVAIFLNMIHQFHTTFIPLYSLAVGLTLTQAGLIKGTHAFCNALTRPLSGYLTKGVGAAKLSQVALPLQAAVIMFVPFFDRLSPLLIIFTVVGFLRAIVLVANTISIVEDVDETQVSRGVASGVFHAAGDLGVVLGPSTGGLIASFTGIARLFFVGPLMIAIMFSIGLWSVRFLSSLEQRQIQNRGSSTD